MKVLSSNEDSSTEKRFNKLDGKYTERRTRKKLLS